MLRPYPTTQIFSTKSLNISQADSPRVAWNSHVLTTPSLTFFAQSKISKARPSIATVRGQILGTDSTKTLIGGGLDNLYILLYVHTLLFGNIWDIWGRFLSILTDSFPDWVESTTKLLCWIYGMERMECLNSTWPFWDDWVTSCEKVSGDWGGFKVTCKQTDTVRIVSSLQAF